ncbi:hypothetical protein [Aquincola sp. J276]|uniref:hypothetical protein n=1 Tax=Aquincola sp. J276 TaxID=2898432 RepID=UPI00215121BB|nr:hypothetical protein [Aquincola sp. J276]MCR5868230.1 hypothetical protein [Aquincola sp. J276]
MQAVYFAPPSFTPEPVANVALALGATRGSFRPGLFVDGREVWFESLADAGEFLRRAYVASGGGDGGDGEGDDDPSPPLPEPPDLPDGPEGEVDDVLADSQRNTVPAARVLLRMATELQRVIPGVEPGTSHDVVWRDIETADGLPALRAGATHMLRELLMRRPRTEEGHTYLRWLSAFRSWWRLVCNLGLRSILLDARGGAFRALLLAWAKQHEPWLLRGPNDRLFPSLLMALLVGGDARMRYLDQGAPWLLEHWERWWHGEYLHPAFLMPQSHGGDTPPGLSMTNLRALPLPRWAWHLVGMDLEGRASLYHLLCTLVAQPQLSTNPKHFELMLFACACVVGGRQPASKEWLFWGFEHAFGPSDVEIGAARQVAHEALRWLEEHLPRSVFSEGYEQAITAAKDIRYRG